MWFGVFQRTPHMACAECCRTAAEFVAELLPKVRRKCAESRKSKVRRFQPKRGSDSVLGDSEYWVPGSSGAPVCECCVLRRRGTRRQRAPRKHEKAQPHLKLLTTDHAARHTHTQTQTIVQNGNVILRCDHWSRLWLMERDGENVHPHTHQMRCFELKRTPLEMRLTRNHPAPLRRTGRAHASTHVSQ